NQYFDELAKSKEGTALLTSAEANEVALEDIKWGDGHGVFSHYLLKGLRGKADGYGGGKKDGIISIGELFEYVRDKVKEDTKNLQHPSIGTSPYDRNLPLYVTKYLVDNQIVFSSISFSFDQKRLEHILNLLENGQVEEFNNLRKNDNNQSIFLPKIDLSDKNLVGIDLHEAILQHSIFKKSKMKGANLTGAILTKADLTEADLRSADLTGAKLDGAKLVNVQLRGADLKGMIDFSNADLTGADLRGVDLDGMVNFEGAILHNVNFQGSNIDKVDKVLLRLNGADIRNVKGFPGTSEPINKYSNVLKQFSENISDLFNKYNVSVDNKKIVEESIKQLVKDIDSIQSSDTIKNIEKEKIQIKIKNLIQKIVEVLPLEIQQISESFSILAPLNEFLDKSNNVTINQLVEYETQRLKSVKESEIANKRNNYNLSKIKKMALEMALAPPLEQEKKKNLFSVNLEKMSELYTQSQGKIVLASSEATVDSREKNDYIHDEHDSPHSHGVFSFHLIEGLKGKAADPDTGIITIESLRKYIENQMLVEQKQRPIYAIAEASNFDNIKIAVDQETFERKIKKLVKEAEEIVERSDRTTGLVNIFALQDAAQKVNKLISLKSDHPEIPRLIDLIDKSLEMYKQPTINWLDSNIIVATEKINEIRDNFYNIELPDLVWSLSFNKLVTLSDNYVKALVYITSHVKKNTQFEKPDDPRLLILTSQLRAVFENERRTKTQEDDLKQFYQDTKHSEIPQLKEKEKRKAIIIGINQYENYEIPTLNGAENDAREIRDKLIQYGNFEISNDHYLVGSHATRRNILRAVSDIFRQDEKCDLVTFYFSGHGVPDLPTSDGYITPYDYDPKDPIISGINMADLKKAIYNAKNIGNTMIILDCCYAGIPTEEYSK
ncbi:MAG TPA: pentapeptide repeat-containing protein, partial [Nitrososphaeraceae archaeon]|nr:pentapeptide repeat-containing protein [Nitrososphaeraceae archaeon]